MGARVAALADLEDPNRVHPLSVDAFLAAGMSIASELYCNQLAFVLPVFKAF